MKIPETSANVGAYYGNDENGQWQPNGVVIDNGVGGGVVGSGDAGIHRPVYPVHVPRPHIPPAGYVMAGPYYGPPYTGAGGGGAGHAPAPGPQPDDFADYMWMENEEEFDKQVLQQLEEEALMEQCIEAMLEDEQRERRNHNHNYPTTSNGTSLSLEEAVSRSTLNPLAAEFVPTTARPPPPAPSTQHSQPQPPPVAPAPRAPSPPSGTTEEQVEVTRESTPEQGTEEATPQHTHIETHTQDIHTEEPVSPPKDPPEVSASGNDVTPKTKKDTPKKVDTKKPKAKPVVVKSETKVQAKKKEVKAVKSELKIDDKDFPVVEVPKSQTTPTEDTKELETRDSKESTPAGPKPINYAAAAKSTKTKQKSTSPPLETNKAVRTENVRQEKQEKQKTTEKLEKKQLSKEKIVQRKNSTK